MDCLAALAAWKLDGVGTAATRQRPRGADELNWDTNFKKPEHSGAGGIRPWNTSSSRDTTYNERRSSLKYKRSFPTNDSLIRIDIFIHDKLFDDFSPDAVMKSPYLREGRETIGCLSDDPAAAVPNNLSNKKMDAQSNRKNFDAVHLENDNRIDGGSFYQPRLPVLYKICCTMFSTDRWLSAPLQ